MEQESDNQVVSDISSTPPIHIWDWKKVCFLVALGLFVVVITIIFGEQFHKKNIPSNERQFTDTSLSIAHIENPKNNFQYFQFILPTLERNIVECDKYADFELNTRCYQSLALLHKDASYCNNIGKSFETGLMHRDDCYDQVARDTHNAALCENIQNKDSLTGDYVSCIASITQDVSKCPPLGDSYNGSYQCYLDSAVSKKDLSICDLFGSDKNSKFVCYRDVAVAKDDVSVCESVPQEDNKRDECYSTVLARTQNQDISLCEKIHVSHWNKYCKLRIAFKTATRENNINTCDSLSDQQSKNDCFWEVANGQNNPLLCELIKPDQYDLDTNQCIVQSSPAMLDDSACDTLKGIHYDTQNKDLCYFQFATVNQKIASCEKMSESSFKEKCLKIIKTDVRRLDPLQSNSTTDWKKYTNTQYGFQIEYPEIGKVSTRTNESQEISLLPGETQFFVKYQLKPDSTKPWDGDVVFSAVVISSAPKKNAEELYNYEKSFENLSVQKFTVGNDRGVLYYSYVPDIGCAMNVLLFHNDSLFVLPQASALMYAPEVVSKECKDSLLLNYDANYRKVLSTFRFTD